MKKAKSPISTINGKTKLMFNAIRIRPISKGVFKVELMTDGVVSYEFGDLPTDFDRGNSMTIGGFDGKMDLNFFK